MKNQDIKVGEHYAYQRHTYARPQEVEVVETAITQQVGYSWEKKYAKNGVRVKFVNGSRSEQTEVVTSRQIKELWSVHEAREAAIRKANAEREASFLAQETERAHTAKQLDAFLRAHGFSAGRHYVGNRRLRTALSAAGFQTDPEDSDFFLSPVCNLQDVVARGNVSITDVRALLADVAVSA